MAKSTQIKPVFMTYKDIIKSDILNSTSILGIVDFGKNKRLTEHLSNKDIPYINAGLKNLTGEHIIELWISKEKVTYHSSENFIYSSDSKYTFGIATKETDSKYIYDTATCFYEELFKITKINHHANLNRIWNFIPQINDITDDKNNYEYFCSGRYQSFKDNNIHQYPAGTAIGTNSSNIAVYFVASSLNDSIYVENPNQTPAYKYKNSNYPCFSRGCYDPLSDIFYISGTASIIDNNSTGIKDIKKQCKTTLENIQNLISKDNLSKKGINKDYTLKDLDCIKVYIKNNKDLDLVVNLCSNTFSKKAIITYLQADICRPELLLEIEGVIQNQSNN